MQLIHSSYYFISVIGQPTYANPDIEELRKTVRMTSEPGRTTQQPEKERHKITPLYDGPPDKLHGNPYMYNHPV